MDRILTAMPTRFALEELTSHAFRDAFEPELFRP